MDSRNIKEILEQVVSGRKSQAEALDALRDLPFADMGVAKHDLHRALRNGFSEVILCEGKRLEHLLHIVAEMAGRGVNLFGTRAEESAANVIVQKFPKADYDPVSRTFKLMNRPVLPLPGRLAILCAGTADLGVAEEARRTAEFFGVEATKHYDVGVAGIHRLFACVDSLREVDAAIAVAGMEGALPSVVGGLISAPVIAVPTSAGYGANLGGIAALLAMLNSCSEGITVVNIDNGFGAACAALRIMRTNARPR
ncbi:MAG: nickel pincer cofactor biosynthesis protein LarB [Pseudomonadota bacterium]